MKSLHRTAWHCLFTFFFISLLHAQTTDLFSFIEEGPDEPIEFKPEAYTPERTLRAFTRSCCTDCDGILATQGIFSQDLYKFTHPINQRSILDLPEFYFFSCLPCTQKGNVWQPFIHLFYNETHKGNFTRDGTGINSYLAFGFARAFEQFGLNFPIRDALSLFEDLKIQERRAGIMLGAARYYSDWYFSFETPLIYLFRNFYLTPEEVRAVEAFFGDSGDLSFARQHLIADRFGIGDSRFNVDYVAIDKPTQRVIFGAEATIPTALSFKRGLYGNHFSKNAPTPTIDLCEICNLIINGNIDAAQAIGVDFSVKALDRLSTILLETSPGNNGHFGAGPVIEYRQLVKPKLEFRTRANLEYIFPMWERRFFIRKKNLAEFEALNNPNFNNPCEQLRFLEQQIIETFFPEGFNTLVLPGFIFKLTNAINGTMAQGKIQLNLGQDIWWQQGETLGKIVAPPEEDKRLR
ncbi:MAG: hypothetical protein AB7R69_04920, partial [Candidatus Babeliales bacterium]